jgi:hypothetical protein
MRIFEVQMFSHLVENVITTFSWSLTNDTRLLQQIMLDITTSQFSGTREMTTDEFTEARRVVVTHGFGVT